MNKRIRRNKSQQAQAILEKLLHDQVKHTALTKDRYDDALAEEAKTRRALESLGMEPLPGLEETVIPPLTLTQLVVAEAREAVGVNTLEELRNSQTAISVSHPHRQRIGEKASISDVWNVKDGSSVIVHTALMYSRQDACEWCRKGTPFATEKRTEHYAVTMDDQGGEYGFEYNLCKGA